MRHLKTIEKLKQKAIGKVAKNIVYSESSLKTFNQLINYFLYYYDGTKLSKDVLDENQESSTKIRK